MTFYHKDCILLTVVISQTNYLRRCIMRTSENSSNKICLDSDIVSLKLSNRVKNIFAYYRIKTIRDLLEYNEKYNLMHMDMFGPKLLKDTEAVLAEYGFTLQNARCAPVLIADTIVGEYKESLDKLKRQRKQAEERCSDMLILEINKVTTHREVKELFDVTPWGTRAKFLVIKKGIEVCQTEVEVRELFAKDYF